MKLKVSITLVILIFVNALTTFSTPIDSLKQKLKSDTDSSKFDTYGSLVTEYVKKGDFKSAMLYANKSLAHAEKIKSKKGDGESSNMIGAVYFYQGKLPEATMFYFRALKNFEAIGYQYGLAQTYVNLGIIHGALKELEKAKKYLNDAATINLKINNKNGLGYVYINLALVYEILGEYENAINTELKAIEIYKEQNSKKELLDASVGLAALYTKTGNYKKALELNEQNLLEADLINYNSLKMGIHNNLGELYFKLNRVQESILHINQAIEIAEKNRDLRNLSELHKNLYSAYKKIGNNQKALDEYIIYTQLRDSVFNEENTKKMVSTQMQYEFDKKEAAIKSKQAIKDAIAKEKIQRQRIIMLSIILGSMLILLTLLLYINRRRTRHALEVNKLENKTLRSQLNPHFIFNALASIQKYMNQHPEKAENYLAKFGKLMRKVLENSEKEFITLEEEFDMLKNYMDLENLRVNKGFYYEINMDENVDAEEVKIPPLLLQPIIENAIWHGVAKGNEKGNISILCQKINQSLKISIENKSENFSENVVIEESNFIKKKSFGLQIVKDRLKLLWKDKGSNSSVESTNTPNGMIVNLVIPI